MVFLKDNTVLCTLLPGTIAMLPTQATRQVLIHTPFLTATLTLTRLIPDLTTAPVELVAPAIQVSAQPLRAAAAL